MGVSINREPIQSLPSRACCRDFFTLVLLAPATLGGPQCSLDSRFQTRFALGLAGKELEPWQRSRRLIWEFLKTRGPKLASSPYNKDHSIL